MEQGRRTWLTSIILLFLLLAMLLFAGDVVFAADQSTASGPAELSGLKKTPYIKGGTTLVLRFADFYSGGYNYSVVNNKTGEKTTGSLRSKKGVLMVNLKRRGMLQANTGYTMEIAAKDGSAKVTTRYFTAKALKDITITQNADHSLAYSWVVSNKKAYTGFLAMASRKKDPVQPEIHEFAAGGYRKISASGLSEGQWYVSGVAYRTVGGYRYYGERVIKKINYQKSASKVKVSGLQAAKGSHSAQLSWNAASGASWYIVYVKPEGGSFTQAANHVKNTSYKVTGLKSKTKYSFAVRPVETRGNLVRIGALSNEDSVKTPKASADVKKISAVFNSKDELSVKWKKVKGAEAYKVYYRKAGQGKYTALGKTGKLIYSLKDLDKNTTYDIVVYTLSKDQGKTWQSPSGSNVLTLKPSEYIKKNYTRLLATKVRTIGYHKWGCEYTTKKYSKEVKLAYGNYKKFSSKTKYLIWVSHYTQQATIFKGSQGNWKIIRSFTVGTGKASSHSPRGIFKIFRKESGWYYNYTKELYISHYAGRNSFHTRPLYNGGGVATSTIGRPCSHGCVRCYNEDARYIYKNIPIGTTVVSY